MDKIITMKSIKLVDLPVNLVLFHAYLVLLLIYFSQGFLYPVGTFVSQVALFICFLIASYFLYHYLIFDRRDYFGRVLIVFLLMNTIYWLLGDAVVYGAHSIDKYKNYLFFILAFYAIYEPVKNGLFNTKTLELFVVLLLLIYCFQYVFGSSIDNVLAIEGGFVNNDAYLFVSMLPVIGLFMRHKLWYLFLYSVLMYFIILGSKRGAVIAFIVGSIFSLYYLYRGLEKKNKLRNVFFILIGLGVIAYYAYDQYIHYYFLQNRIRDAMEGDSSGREIIYSLVYRAWYDSDNVWNMLFGYGFNGARKLVHMYAHNDWLELLAGQGMLGVSVYLFVFYGLVEFYLKNKRFLYAQEKSIYLTVLSMWFVQSLFSMGYGGLYTFTYTLSVGYLMGVVYNRKKEALSKIIASNGKICE